LQEVKEFIWDKEEGVQGVATVKGEEFRSKLVLSNATPEITFLRLLPKEALDPEFRAAVQAIDYKSPVTKINGKKFFQCRRTCYFMTYDTEKIFYRYNKIKILQSL